MELSIGGNPQLFLSRPLVFAQRMNLARVTRAIAYF
jgi:hypothetical protein